MSIWTVRFKRMLGKRIFTNTNNSLSEPRSSVCTPAYIHQYTSEIPPVLYFIHLSSLPNATRLS